MYVFTQTLPNSFNLIYRVIQSSKFASTLNEISLPSQLGIYRKKCISKEKVLMSYVFKISKHTVGFFSYFSICFKEPDSSVNCNDKHLTIRGLQTDFRLFTQQDAQKWVALHCFGSTMESSRARPFISRPTVPWSQDGCSSSRHHNPTESQQVQTRTHKFNLDKKSFPDTSSTFLLNSPWPEQYPVLNHSLVKSNGITTDGLSSHGSSLRDASFHL